MLNGRLNFTFFAIFKGKAQENYTLQRCSLAEHPLLSNLFLCVQMLASPCESRCFFPFFFFKPQICDFPPNLWETPFFLWWDLRFLAYAVSHQFYHETISLQVLPLKQSWSPTFAGTGNFHPFLVETTSFFQTPQGLFFLPFSPRHITEQLQGVQGFTETHQKLQLPDLQTPQLQGITKSLATFL